MGLPAAAAPARAASASAGSTMSDVGGEVFGLGTQRGVGGERAAHRAKPVEHHVLLVLQRPLDATREVLLKTGADLVARRGARRRDVRYRLRCPLDGRLLRLAQHLFGLGDGLGAFGTKPLEERVGVRSFGFWFRLDGRDHGLGASGAGSRLRARVRGTATTGSGSGVGSGSAGATGRISTTVGAGTGGRAPLRPLRCGRLWCSRSGSGFSGSAFDSDFGSGATSTVGVEASESARFGSRAALMRRPTSSAAARASSSATASSAVTCSRVERTTL